MPICSPLRTVVVTVSAGVATAFDVEDNDDRACAWGAAARPRVESARAADAASAVNRRTIIVLELLFSKRIIIHLGVSRSFMFIHWNANESF